MTEYEKDYFNLIGDFPKYAIGDIICVRSTDAHLLIEDIQGWEYCFRILDNNNTRRDSVAYIDGHNDIIKVA